MAGKRQDVPYGTAASSQAAAASKTRPDTLKLQEGYDPVAKLRADFSNKPDPRVALPVITIQKKGEVDKIMRSLTGMFSNREKDQKSWPKGVIFDLPKDYLCNWHSPLPCVYWLIKNTEDSKKTPLVHVCPGYYTRALAGDDGDVVTCYPYPLQKNKDFRYLEIFNRGVNAFEVERALVNMRNKKKLCGCGMLDPIPGFELKTESDGGTHDWITAKIVGRDLEEQMVEAQKAVSAQDHVHSPLPRTLASNPSGGNDASLVFESRLSIVEQKSFVSKIASVVSSEFAESSVKELKSLMHTLAGHSWMELWNRHDPNLALQEYFRTGLFLEATDANLTSDFLTMLFLEHCSIREELPKEWSFDNLCRSEDRRFLVSMHGLPLPAKYHTVQIDFRSDKKQFELHQYVEGGTTNEFPTAWDLRQALNPAGHSLNPPPKKARATKCLDFRIVVPTHNFNLRITMADEKRSAMERRLAYAVLHLRSENPGQRTVNFSPYQEYLAIGFDTTRENVDLPFLESLNGKVHSAMMDDVHRSFARCPETLKYGGIEDWSVDRWKNNNLTVITDHLASVLCNAGRPNSQWTAGYLNLGEKLRAIASRSFPNSGVQLYLYADYLIRVLTPLVELEHRITQDQYPVFCRIVVEAKQEARREALSVRNQVFDDFLDEFLNSDDSEINLGELHLTEYYQEYSEQVRRSLAGCLQDVPQNILHNIIVDPSDDDVAYILEESSSPIVEEQYTDHEARGRRTELQEVCKLMLQITRVIWPSCFEDTKSSEQKKS